MNLVSKLQIEWVFFCFLILLSYMNKKFLEKKLLFFSSLSKLLQICWKKTFVQACLTKNDIGAEKT